MNRTRTRRRAAPALKLVPRLGAWAGLVLLAMGVGCVSAGSRSRPLHAAERYPGAAGDEGEVVTTDPRTLPMFAAASDAGSPGARIDWESLIERARASDIVLIGESHAHPLGGAFSVALFEDLLGGDEATQSVRRRAALSLEFFSRDEQADLDDYLADLDDEETFKKRTSRVGASEFGPGNYPSAHREMILIAKDAGCPVIGANAPRRYVTAAREESFDRLRELTEEQRRLFAVPRSLTEGAYRDRFFDEMAETMAEHMPEVEPVEPGEGDPAMAEAQQRNLDRAAYELIKGYYRAQNVWDATMADSIVRALNRGLGPVLHVVGQFHVQHDGGLLQRLRSRRPGARILTIVLADDTPGRVTDRDEPTLREEDVNRADVVIYVGDPAGW